jgi:nicotinamidase-related amidase
MGYDSQTTSLLLVDPYNDFLSEGGKVWPRVKAIAEEVKLLDHLRALVAADREKRIRIYLVSHHGY